MKIQKNMNNLISSDKNCACVCVFVCRCFDGGKIMNKVYSCGVIPSENVSYALHRSMKPDEPVRESTVCCVCECSSFP